MDPLGGLGKSQQVNGQAAIDDQGKKGRDDRADDKLEQERNLIHAPSGSFPKEGEPNLDPNKL